MVNPESIERTRQARLVDMVAYVRANSPYYRELYAGLPSSVEDVRLLPVTDKKKMMARFNDWATDRDVTHERVQAFLADSALIGKPFLGKYRVSQTSGSTGTRLTFVSDEKAEAATKAQLKQMMLSWLGWFGAISFLFQSQVLRKGRTASIIATGGHTSAFSRASMNADKKSDEKRKVFSVHSPIAELVSQLNEYRPNFLQGYASTLLLLADEQKAGRLHIHPQFVLPTSEGLLDRQYDEISNAFKAKIGIL